MIEIPVNRQGIFDNKGKLVMIFNPNPIPEITDDKEIPGDYFIYFLQARDGNKPIKIGVTSDINKRLSQLRNTSPVNLQLLKAIEADKDLEQDIHRRFKDDRLHGEWFNPTPELLRFIGSL